MDISRMKFCLDNAEHQIKIQETHINRTGRAPCNDLRWIQSVYDRLTDGPPKTTDAAVQTTASGECGFTLPSQPAQVVHGTRAYNVELINDELIEVVEIIPTELRHQLSKSNLKRQIGDIYEYTSLAHARARRAKYRRCRLRAAATLRLSTWRAHGTGLPAEHDVVSLGLKSLSVNPPPQPGSRPEFEAHHSHSAAANRLFRDANRGPAETLHVHVYRVRCDQLFCVLVVSRENACAFSRCRVF